MTCIRVTALAVCLLAGCSATNDETASAKEPIPPPSATGTSACFYPRQVQNFVALDRSNLIVFAPNAANAYHVRITPPSTQLEFAEGLAFLPPSGRVCGYAGERLIVGIGPAAERVAVIDVSRLAPGGLEALQAGRTGATAPAARPQPGPGADIEGATSGGADGQTPEQPATAPDK
jgi:hypothetical protein